MTTGTPPPTAPRRSRARTFVPLAIAAWAVLEIWLLTLVADVAGGFTVLLLLIGGVVLGAVVMKAAGRRAFRNLTETLQQMPGRPGEAAAPSTAPSGSKGNGFLMLGGLLLIIPGMISDMAGLLLLVPPVRATLGRYAERSLDRRMRTASPGSLSDAFQQVRIHRPDGKVVQGEVIRDTETRPGPRPDSGPRPPLTP
ncbi:FxsA family membrane protein [Streptomyces sp. NPDC002596]|uniref:FxsA family membrane protein n=1 Tax=unclassified Streptomyces TaxID=2593676 RepID=UPI0022513F4C|nr:MULTISPECIES: FxsA family membrane protein [unclassified Streptomyces]MCX4536427.1 FxsA family protein [Streptomyces sp. NBC_01669]WRZ98335.1 FxsA family protein [Streptomyces sp. NBC_00841]